MQTNPPSPTGLTAPVTGATGGIGRDLATHCARGGFNLVLVARRPAELDAVATGLRERYGREITTITAGLSESSSGDGLADDLAARSLTIDVLINNAGYAQYGSFVETDPDAEMRMMQLNMVTPTRLGKRLLPAMQARRLMPVIVHRAQERS